MSDFKIVVEVVGVPKNILSYPPTVSKLTNAIQSAIAEIKDLEIERENVYCHFIKTMFVVPADFLDGRQEPTVFFRYSATSHALLDGAWANFAHLRVINAIKNIILGVSFKRIS